MKLYRARLVSDRPTRHPVFTGNTPADRARGRWFTSDIDVARIHGETLHAGKDWEIVMVNIKDTIVDYYSVAARPKTNCGLTPGDFSTNPETDYLVPLWLANDGVALAEGSIRQRDYLFEPHSVVPLASKSERVIAIAESYGLPIENIKIAA